jgi:A/G-specific adenine glycosylase
LALPGIGRYTAGAICSIAFNQPKPILDGNVIRVLTRLFGIAENPKEKKTNARLWQLAEELVQEAHTSRWGERPREPAFGRQRRAPARGAARPPNSSPLNQSLMELGALVCTPRSPQCQLCPVQKQCVAFKDGQTEALPSLGKRKAATARRFLAFAIEHNGKFLVRQRPAGVVNAYLWEFPNLEVGSRTGDPLDVFGELDAVRITDPQAINLKPLVTVKHSITRYRITVEAFMVSLKRLPVKNDGVWRSPAQMAALAFTSAHKKLASAAAKSILSDR